MKKIFLLACVCLGILLFFGCTLAPANFPTKKIVKIDTNLSASDIGTYLKDQRIIRSSFVFKVLAYKKNIKAGSYYFEGKESIFSVISRLKEGKSNIPFVRITIPEGSNNEQIAAIIWGKIEKFNAPQFLKKALKYRGYLFPDTYNIPITADEELVISILRNTFEKKAGKVSSDIVMMASILEEEGNAADNRKMIADILWRRLHMNMALQVDVAPETYKKRGLPTAPITNPGLQSIEAAQNPTTNPYLYYISSKDGIFHYAKTYEEHLVNIQKYLKK
jgi:UPF0755 protein